MILLSVLVAGCSSSSSLFGTSSPPPAQQASDEERQDFGDKVMDFFITGKQGRPKSGTASSSSDNDIDCPSVTVREGAATWTVNGPGEPSAMTLRYQGTVSRTARDCKVVAKTVQMKVGMEGRVILGPAGSPGKVDIPLRFAVVKEGPVPQTILTRTYRKEVDIAAGAGNVPFLEIDDTISFPMPAVSADIEDYVVYVGFDPELAKKPAPRKPGPRKPRAPKPPRTSQQ